MDQHWAKNSFLNLLKNLIINFSWIWCIVKVSIMCYIPTQIPYLGNWYQSYGAKYYLPIRLQNIYINYISEIAWFFAYWYKFMEIKSWLKNIEVDVVKWNELIFWHADIKLGKQKVTSIIIGWALSRNVLIKYG